MLYIVNVLVDIAHSQKQMILYGSNAQQYRREKNYTNVHSHVWNSNYRK